MVAVVVLTYRATDEVLGDCLRAAAGGHLVERLVVVDNGQRLERADIERLVPHSVPPIDLLRTVDNLGYAGGMNVGIAHALEGGADVVAVLNDDTRPAADWLDHLVPHLAAGAGAVQPKLLLPDGRVQSVGVRWRADGAGIDIGYGEPDGAAFAEAREVAIFTGAAVALSRRLLESVGGFDERLFLYYEDVDLALRAGAAGFRFVVEPAAVVVHALSTTTSADPERRRYFQERNRLWCLARHGTWGRLAAGLARSAARSVKHPTRAQWRAVGAGLASVPYYRRQRRLSANPHPLPAPAGLPSRSELR